MATRLNPSAGSQGDYGAGQHHNPVPAGSGPGDGDDDSEESGHDQQYIELPEHQGVIVDYIPPRGGLRSEVGDIDGDGEADDLQS